MRRLLTGWYDSPSVMKLVENMKEDYEQTGKTYPNFSFLPRFDGGTQKMVDDRALSKTVNTALLNTVYYRRVADKLGMSKFEAKDFGKFPVTTKNDFRGKEYEFVDQEASEPILAFSSTGTTAFPPTSAWMGKKEMEFLAAVNAFSLLSSGVVLPDDIIVSTFSSRSMFTNWVSIDGYKHIGATLVHCGVISPDECLHYLTRDYVLPGKRRKASVLTAYPSYLDYLCQRAGQLGIGPGEFEIRRIIVGGEVLTRATTERARRLFPTAELTEFYNISECIQLSGSVCPKGNMHFPPLGRVDVLDRDDGSEVSEGEVGALVLTPFKPPREVTLLIKYDTGDMVRKQTDCGCGIKGVVVSKPLGKRSDSLIGRGLTYRELFEMLSDLPGVEPPVKAGVELDGANLVIHVASKTPSVAASIAEWFNAKGISPPKVVVHDDGKPFAHYPLRCELLEQTFSNMMKEWDANAPHH